MGFGGASELETVTLATVAEVLKHDNAVKVAGIDIDGIPRGKLMAKSKFLSLCKAASKDGEAPKFGFCSVVFGWDMHDHPYFRELKISNKANGYRDITARVDLTSFRRLPWEYNRPFFLVSFEDPDTEGSLSACPRSLLARMTAILAKQGLGAMAGGK